MARPAVTLPVMRRLRHYLFHVVFTVIPMPAIAFLPIFTVIIFGLYQDSVVAAASAFVGSLFAYLFGFLMGKTHQRPKMLGLTVVIGDTVDQAFTGHLRAQGVPEGVVEDARTQLRDALVDAARRRAAE